MIFNYEIGDYRLHSISKLDYDDDNNFKPIAQDVSYGLGIEKKCSGGSYIVIAFLKPSEELAGYLCTEFVGERIMDIKKDDWEIFRALYLKAHEVILGKDSILYSMEEGSWVTESSDEEPEPDRATGAAFSTTCLVCGEKITYPAEEWYNSTGHVSPYVKICDSCKQLILKNKNKKKKEGGK